jgi:single-stranded-DNA-specific exonuclease
VIGIVASRVVEHIHRPTVLVAIDEDGARARGSARSIPGFHLYEAVRDCGALLERYGGHRQAAGLEVRPDRIAALRDAFNARARAVLAPDDLLPRLRIDLDIHLADITTDLFALLRHFGPFGIGNPSPVFGVRDVRVVRPPRTVGAGHARLVLEQDGARLQAIGFGMAERVRDLDVPRNRLDVVFHLLENRWSGRLQARLIDARVAR